MASPFSLGATSRPRPLRVLQILLLLVCGLTTAMAQQADDTKVYQEPGKKRVHVEGCKRLTTDPVEREKFMTMTLAEAKEKGLELCSRCPGSTTPGKGKPAEPAAAAGEGDDEASGSSEGMAADTTVYRQPGKKRVHIEGCRRLPTEPLEREKFMAMTLAEAKEKGLELCSRCPGSTTPGKRTNTTE